MGIPAVTVKKSLVGGSPALQSTQGILAIIASSSTVPNPSIPTMLTNQNLTTSTFGSGFLPEAAVYEINVSGQPVVALAVTTSIAGSYYASTFVKNITGSSAVTTGATAPYLHYDVVVTIIAGGTIGSAGITYTWSVDGGDATSAVTALGTNTTLTIPNTGVSFNLGAGTLLAGDNWSIYTERPLLNNSDVATALATLGNTKLPWEGVLVDAQYGTGTVALVDEWLAGREANGQFNFALLNTRFLLEPTPTAEAPATYAAAITAQSSQDTSNRLCLCADGGHLTSLITGFTTKFPTSLALAGQAMAVTPNIGIDPAFVGLGPVSGFEISSDGNPNDWDEFLYQSLDSQRLTTLRTFATGGPTGTFITDANVLISAGSNIYWLQLLRVLNKACAISWQILNTQLSKAVATVYNATTGAINIAEKAAQTIEALVNGPLTSGLSGQVTAVAFSLNRDDNLVTPKAPINASVSIAPLVYLKNIVVTAALVKSISVPLGGA
jgi:Protein of unknown function (DUF2586)